MEPEDFRSIFGLREKHHFSGAPPFLHLLSWLTSAHLYNDRKPMWTTNTNVQILHCAVEEALLLCLCTTLCLSHCFVPETGGKEKWCNVLRVKGTLVRFFSIDSPLAAQCISGHSENNGWGQTDLGRMDYGRWPEDTEESLSHVRWLV